MSLQTYTTQDWPSMHTTALSFVSVNTDIFWRRKEKTSPFLVGLLLCKLGLRRHCLSHNPTTPPSNTHFYTEVAASVLQKALKVFPHFLLNLILVIISSQVFCPLRHIALKNYTIKISVATMFTLCISMVHVKSCDLLFAVWVWV